jgi:hypothetical protein
MQGPAARQADLSAPWPALPLDGWRDTYATLHMWTQVVGKVCLALTPLTNHFWNIALRVTSTGLATPTMTSGGVTFAMAFDFVNHELIIRASDGRVERVPLAPRSVADFYQAVMTALERLGVSVRIWTTPVEVPDPIPFERDSGHHTYDPEAARACWKVLLAITPIFERFRAGFVGKCSPVHFFWGSFDLAVTRFSGERAPERPGADAITRESYSHCVISHGFWPGNQAVPQPAFYAYAAPPPEGLERAAVAPAAAYYDTGMSEFILPYETVRTAASPARELETFLHSTYEAAADLAGWNRSQLERV